MTALAEAQERYLLEQPRYQEAAKETAALIRQAAVVRHLSCDVSSRAKDVSSFVKKAISKSYQDPWNEITDKAGVRIIVPHGGLLDDARTIVVENFEVLGEEDTRDDEGLDDRLVYPRLHMQVYAPGGSSSDGEYPLECEIQIRSEAADLWARMSHTHLYKPVTQTPRPIRRSLVRLLALVELFDAEVARAVGDMEQSPEYGPDLLLAEAERLYYTFASTGYSVDLSRLVCRVLVEVIGPNIADFSAQLPNFASEHGDHLRKVYSQYGGSSKFASQGRYLLAGQPESIVVFQLLENRPYALRNTWEEADLPDVLLDDLAGIWGVAA